MAKSFFRYALKTAHRSDRAVAFVVWPARKDGAKGYIEMKKRRYLGYKVNLGGLALLALSACEVSTPGNVLCWESDSYSPISDVSYDSKYSSTSPTSPTSSTVCVPIADRTPVPHKFVDNDGSGSRGDPTDSSSSGTPAGPGAASAGPDGAFVSDGGSAASAGPDGAFVSDGGSAASAGTNGASVAKSGSAASAGPGGVSVSDGSGAASAGPTGAFVSE
jgi:hypothetical protein